jgi:nucleoside-diphosphate-sugar epimerase
MMRVLVTGAAGFVGQHLCRDLVASNISVRGLVRAESKAPLLSGVELLQGDVTDERTIRAAMDGIDAVVHLAARVHVMRDTAPDPLAEFRRVNVAGTRTLALMARDAGVKHIVFASSVKAVGDVSTAPWDSSTPAHPVDAYGISKLEAEQLLFALQSHGSPRVTVLRFPLLYGPGMKGNMLRLFRIVSQGWPVPVGSVENARSILFVGNAAAAITHLIGGGPTRSSTHTASGPFFVADGPGLSTAALATDIATALGVTPRTVRIHQGLLRMLGHIGDPVTGGRISAVFNRLLGSLEVDENEFERAYSFEPPYTMEQGLGITARWFLQA